MADATQIEQVLLNLCANARDAMPKGGQLTIATTLAEIDDRFLQVHGYGKPGKYALLAVADTGTGMDQKTRDKLFEPFFTTKEVGKGTGMGLSIVYGIIKQQDGYILVDSEPSRGTTFSIYLPLTDATVKQLKIEELGAICGDNETILLVEDNAQVRFVTKELLAGFGYQLIEAVDGADGIEKFMANSDKVALLLLDVVMPKKNGREVAEAVKHIKPEVKILFMSGYPANILDVYGLAGHADLIGKPASPGVMLRKIRELLDLP
jgi:CheY-like chemotaxis protein